MMRSLRAFHVAAPDQELLRRHDAEIRWGPGRYYVTAVMGPLDAGDCRASR